MHGEVGPLLQEAVEVHLPQTLDLPAVGERGPQLLLAEETRALGLRRPDAILFDPPMIFSQYTKPT